MDDIAVTNVGRHHRYESTVGCAPAGFTEYLDRDGQRIFYHTETDEAFAGRGLAGTLVTRALADTRDNGMRIVALCPFVAGYVRKHHDFDDSIDPVTAAIISAVEEVVQDGDPAG
ncbi:MAG: N-acetyltransferase [Streptosporangiales bacterium]|nr:N-acetyltransferase [Streptosporangiales bacterium]